MDSNAQLAVKEFLAVLENVIPDHQSSIFDQPSGVLSITLPDTYSTCFVANHHIELRWEQFWLSLVVPVSDNGLTRKAADLLALLSVSPLPAQVVMDRQDRLWLVSQLPLESLRTSSLCRHFQWLTEKVAILQNRSHTAHG